MATRNIEDCTRRCRCQDPEGRVWIYLNAFCKYAEDHKPWADYGNTKNSIMTSAAEYARAWLAGEYNDHLPPEGWPQGKGLKPRAD